MLNSAHILELLKKNVRREALTEEETEELALALRVLPEEMQDELLQQLERETGLPAVPPRDPGPLIARILSEGKETPQQASSSQLLWKVAAVAAILTGVVAGSYYTSRLPQTNGAVSRCDSIKFYRNGIPAGVDKASLTLFNGDQVLLDSTFEKLATVQGSTLLRRLETGEFKYTNQPGRVSDSSLYNTITTSRGTQCVFILPDGTTARLNALSSLRFPLCFAGSSREVAVTGEVYFDVSKSGGKPFYVQVNNTRLKVTGTRFNVNAYDRTVSTTLISGSLTIQNGAGSTALKPGQQAVIANNTSPVKAVSMSSEDVARITSWKDGYLAFKRKQAGEAMEEIARWFDLELVNKDKIPYWMTLTGVVCRGMSLSELVGLLRVRGLQFQVEGRKLVF